MPDLTSFASTFRAGGYRCKLYLSYLPYTVQFAASVNGTPAFSTTGSIQSIEVDNVTTGSILNAVSGMNVQILSSAGVHKGWTRVAYGGGSGTTLQIAELSQGTINIADDDLVKVYQDFPIRDKLVSATAALKKDSRITYSDQGSDPPPVCNSGGVGVGFDTGSGLSLNFYGSTSRTIDPDSGGTITHAWTFPGATPGSSVDTNPTGIVFPAGSAVWATHAATDASNSKITVQYIPVWAHNTSTYAPIELSQCRLSYTAEDGHRVEFQVADDSKATAALMPDGCMVVIWAQEYFGDTQASYGSNVTGRSHIKFVGYLDEAQIRVIPGTSEVAFTAISPLAVLGKTPALSQLTIQKASPTKWQHLKSNSVYRTLWYLWYWHNTAFNAFDFVLPSSGDLSYTRLALTIISNQLEQFRDLAGSMGLVVTCDRLGRLIVQKNPQLLSTSDRSSRTTAYNYNVNDLLDMEWREPSRWQSKTVVGEGITDGSTTSAQKAIFSRAPGTAPAALGTNVETLDKQIVDSQSDLNTRTGLRFAEVNSLYNGRIVPKGAGITVPDGYDFIDPSYLEFLTFTVASTTNARARSWDTTTRWLAQTSEVNYQPDTGGLDVHYTIDHETYGPDGRTEIRPQPADNGLPNLPPVDILIPGIDLPPLVIGDLLGKGTPNIALWNTDGYVYLTGDANTPSAAGGPTWTRTLLSGLGMSGTLEDFVADAFSPLYTGSGTTVNGWLVTTTGIYRVTDVFSVSGGLTLTLQHTFTTSANLRHRAIDASFGFVNKVAVISQFSTTGAATGTRWAYTTDGSTWAEVQIGNYAGVPLPIVTQWPGLHISSQVSGLCYAMAGVSGVYSNRLHKSLDWGATWALVTPTVAPFADGGNHSGLVVPFHNNPNDKLLFVTGRTAGTNNYADLELDVVHVGTDTGTDITPGAGAPGVYRRGLTFLGNNRLFGAFIERIDGGGGSPTRKIWTTTTGGETAGAWTHINTNDETTQGYSLDSVALAGGPYSAHMYLWGNVGGFAYSSDMGVTIDDRRGNMPTLGVPTRVVNICGG